MLHGKGPVVTQNQSDELNLNLPLFAFDARNGECRIVSLVFVHLALVRKAPGSNSTLKIELLEAWLERRMGKR